MAGASLAAILLFSWPGQADAGAAAGAKDPVRGRLQRGTDR
jgi:hypothetical protein